MQQESVENELGLFGYKQQLNRSLNVWQLTAFGLNYMIPIAPAMIFGYILMQSGGTVALPYLLAGISMIFTGISYAILMPNFPLAGSLYSYIGRGMHPQLGFLAGWVILLDYILGPVTTSISAALYAKQLIPFIPYEAWLLLFIGGMGFFNLFGVKLLANFNLMLFLIGEFIVVVAFFVWIYAVVYHHVGIGHLFSLTPFYFSNTAALAGATSLAIFSYIGFDAITTLAEEAKHPKRDIPRAIYWSISVGGITMFLTGYLAMLVIPDWKMHAHNSDWMATILFQVAKITGGQWFSLFYAIGFLLAMGVFNIVGTAASARLLFGMGRDGRLPKAFFGAVNQRWQTPHWNIIFIVVLECILGSLFSLDNIAELVNYGALLGFITLNLTVIWLYYIKRNGNAPLALGETPHWLPPWSSSFKYFISPLLGATLLLWVFCNLKSVTLIVGTSWLLIGIVYSVLKRVLPSQNQPPDCSTQNHE